MKVELDGLCFGFSAVDKFLGEQCDFSCIPECIIFGHDLCLFWNAGLRSGSLQFSSLFCLDEKGSISILTRLKC